ncbi:MAG TPA: DUF6537 domain-containing protein [Nitrospiria bacterium]|nr:DUF6537 domain-containing protein [Nitrospiria bacterium]
MVNDSLIFALIGLLGSYHCVAFCGPILFTTNARSSRTDILSGLFSLLPINLGRILTYSILGLIGGVVGSGIINIPLFINIQWIMGIFSGTLMIYIGLVLLEILPGRRLLEGESLLKLPSITRFFTFTKKSRYGELLSGMIMGLIPCGMVYAVLAKAVSTGDPIRGSVFMFSFGLGTMISMLFVGLIIKKQMANRSILKYSYILIALAGMIVIARTFAYLPGQSEIPSLSGSHEAFHAIHPIFTMQNLLNLLYLSGLILGLVGISLLIREAGRKDIRRKRYVMINEDICEGCNDCIAKAGCIALREVETEYGKKVQIHYPSCSQSFSCLAGYCPSLLTIEVPEGVRPKPRRVKVGYLPPIPSPHFNGGPPDLYKIIITGMDSAGVARVNAVLTRAAILEGKLGYEPGAYVLSGDKGTAIACCILSEGFVDDPDDYETDLILGLDLDSTAIAVNLDGTNQARTIAVLSDLIPKVAIAQDLFPIPDGERRKLKEKIDNSTLSTHKVYGEYLAEKLLGDYMMGNLFILGIAYQAGLIPLSVEALEAGIRESCMAAEEEIDAFKLGRGYYMAPDFMMEAIEADDWSKKDPKERALARLKAEEPTAIPEFEKIISEILVDEMDLKIKIILLPRIADLILYQDSRYARDYARFVLRTMRSEKEAGRGRLDITIAVARNLFKLMAYKDEYEVARLHRANLEKITSIFGGSFKASYHVYPYLFIFSMLGLRHKIVFGGWFRLVLRLLASLKWIRRYPWNPFGFSPLRQKERALISWYRQSIESLLFNFFSNPYDNYNLALRIALAPEKISGYGEVKEGLIDSMITALREEAHQANLRKGHLSSRKPDLSLIT